MDNSGIDPTLDADLNAISGNGNASDYDVLTGGTYSTAQDPYSAVDDGTLNNGTTGTGTASGAPLQPPSPASATYTPPSWLSGIFSTAVNAAQTAQTAANSIAPLINGSPAASPAAAGLAPSNGLGKTIFTLPGGISVSPIMLLVLAVGAFFLLRKKR